MVLYVKECEVVRMKLNLNIDGMSKTNVILGWIFTGVCIISIIGIFTALLL